MLVNNKTIMLPGIKEDNSAIFSTFRPKNHSKYLQSSCKFYIVILKKKLKQIKAGPIIRIPEVLLRHRQSKRNKDAKTFAQGFPTIQDMMDKFKSFSRSPEKRKCDFDMINSERPDSRKRPSNNPKYIPYSNEYNLFA